MLVIRDATPEDTPVIARFIRELAVFMDIEHEVTFELAGLHQQLFGEEAFVEVLIAEEDGQPIGFTLFYKAFSTVVGKPWMHAEDLYVVPECRGKGYGSQLLGRIAQRAIEQGCCWMELEVQKSSERVQRLYRKLGGHPLDQWRTYEFTLEHLHRMAELVESDNG